MSTRAELLRGYHRLADVIITDERGMPAASASDPDGKRLERGLRSRPDLAELLPALVELAQKPQARNFLGELYETNRQVFEQLYTLVISIYYMNPKVLKLLNYPGQKPNPAVSR